MSTIGVLAEGGGKKTKSAEGQDARIRRYEDEHCASSSMRREAASTRECWEDRLSGEVAKQV